MDFSLYSNELARRHLIDFVTETKKNYKVKWFHSYVCEKIEQLVFGDIKKLMIFMPPQHGKSEISSRRLPAWYMGHFPDNKLALISYNQTFVSKFNRNIQEIMDSPKYKNIFDTRLPEKWETKVRNSLEVEISNGEGSIKSVGVGGALTGSTVDLLIIDDVYKDHESAWSPVGRASVENWYSSAAETRLHNDSKILIVFTRWDEDDLAGYLLANEANQWEVVSIPAILESENQRTEKDKRKIGEALWESRHSLEKLNRIKKRDKVVFNNLYQQDPQPAEGLLYDEFKTHKRKEWGFVCAKIDVADSGDDYLTAGAYEKDADNAYIRDVLYTQEGHKTSESMLINFLKINNVQEATFESNSSGNIYADNIEKECIAQGININIKKFSQSKNKEARILGASTFVNNKIIMPEGWEIRYSNFHKDITRFKRLFRANKHDDAPDMLTMIAEEFIHGNCSGFA